MPAALIRISCKILDTIFETIRTRFHEKKYEHDIFVATTPTTVNPRDEALEELTSF